MKNFILQFIRDPKLYQYLIVGGLCALIDLAFFILFRQTFELHYLIIATLSFMIATLANYFLCNRFVFKHQQRHASHTRLALTYLVSSVGLGIHHSCLFIAYEWLTLPMVLSKIMAMGIAFSWNFLSRKKLVFTPA